MMPFHQFLYVYKVQIFISAWNNFATGLVTLDLVLASAWSIYLEMSFEINMISID